MRDTNIREIIFLVHFHACSRICSLASEHMNELMNEFGVLNELMNEHMNEFMTQHVMNGENYLPINIDCRISALGIVGDLLKKVGALELKLV